MKPDIKPSVTLDKTKGLDVHVPVSTGNPIDFNSLQGLITYISISIINNKFSSLLVIGGCHVGLTFFMSISL